MQNAFQQEPDESGPKKVDKTTIVEPLPNNARIRTEVTHPSLFQHLAIRCNRIFWTWLGLPDLADDIETHGATLKKAAVLTLLAVTIVLTATVTYGLKGCADSDDKDNARKFETLYNQDENSLGPLRQIANEKFGDVPPDKRIDLALRKLNDIDTKISLVDPNGQPIAAGTVSVTVDVIKSNPEGNVTNIIAGGGPMIGLGRGKDALIIARAGNLESRLIENGVEEYRADATVTSDSAYLGKPISSLKDAEYIQIDLGSSFIPSNSMITGGSVVWVFNNSITRKFSIPTQPAIASHIMVRDLGNGFNQ